MLEPYRYGDERDDPATDFRARLFRVLATMGDMSACDMGHLTRKDAKRFHKATELISAILHQE
jgi:hypothetical protein